METEDGEGKEKQGACRDGHEEHRKRNRGRTG